MAYSVIELPSTPNQPVYDKREASRLRIVVAANNLVKAIGYPAVKMTDVAEEAGVSRATLYRYYSTKEQLYRDVAINWAINFIDQLRQQPPAGRTVGDRINEVIQTTLETAAKSPQLMAAYIATMVDDESKLQKEQQQLKALMPRVIKIAIGTAQLPRLELTTITLQHMLISNMILLNVGKTNSQQIVAEMQQLASQLLAESWGLPWPLRKS
ncbi:MAG: AcrR family transcriptional regulator [Oceanicoccus sp.]|jgi:AcrR family transcriptional regulator